MLVAYFEYPQQGLSSASLNQTCAKSSLFRWSWPWISVVTARRNLSGRWVEDLRQRLRERLAARRTRQEIEVRARELWEQNGCPAGRDLEFWLQAEAEISRRNPMEASG
jgi:hypothetical protein